MNVPFYRDGVTIMSGGIHGDTCACMTCYPVNYPSTIAEVGVPTLRDRFAMAALTGLYAATSPASDSEAAEWAYEIADAMLAARSASKEDKQK